MPRRVIGSILINVEANLATLKEGMQEAESVVSRSALKLEAQAVQFAKASAVAATAAAAAITATVNATRANIDEQAKFADRIGVSTEALGGLQFSAELTGVSVNQLNLGLQRMTRRVSEAAQGTGEAKNALKELGIDAAELNRQKPDEQFRRIADAFEGIESQSDKVRLAMRLFDSEGVALVNTLKLGRDGLEGMQEEAERLGIALSRVDAAQVEAANDAISGAAAVSRGFANQLTVELAPAIAAVATMYRDAALASDSFVDASALIGDIAVGAIGSLGDTFEEVSLGILESRAQLASFAAFAVEVAQQLNVFGLSDAVFGISAEEVTQSIQAWRDLGESYAKEYEDAFADRLENGAFSDRFKKELERRRKEVADSVSAIGGSLGDVGGDSPLSDDQKKALTEIEGILKQNRSALQEYNDSIATLNIALTTGKLSQDEYNTALEIFKTRLNESIPEAEALNKAEQDKERIINANKTALEKLNEELERARGLAASGILPEKEFEKAKERIEEDIKKIQEAGKEINKVGQDIADGMQDVVSDGFVSIWKGGFDEVLANFGDLLINLAAEAAAADFLNAIGFGGKDNKGGNLGNLFDGLFSFDGGGYTGAGSRTGGLDGRGGFLSVLHPNETVVDHTKGQAVGGNTNININYSGTGNRAEDRRAAGAFARDLNNRLDSGRRYS